MSDEVFQWGCLKKALVSGGCSQERDAASLNGSLLLPNPESKWILPSLFLSSGSSSSTSLKPLGSRPSLGIDQRKHPMAFTHHLQFHSRFVNVEHCSTSIFILSGVRWPAKSGGIPRDWSKSQSKPKRGLMNPKFQPAGRWLTQVLAVWVWGLECDPQHPYLFAC